MLSDNVREFLKENRNAVLTTFRKDGAAQMSVVTCGLYRDGAAFTTEGKRAKLHNLRRDPRCSLLVSKPNWYGYVVLEGRAEVLWTDNTDADELRLALRGAYQAAAAKEHPDWEEYDAAMLEQRRAAIIVRPERTYGMGPV